MAPMAPDVPLLDTYQAVVTAFCDFLTVAIHTITYERNIYPPTSYIRARKYNHPVRQSRHPKVCQWIQDAVAAVETEMLKCSVASTSLIIHSPPPASKPLERYVFSTASFPRVDPSDHLIPFADLSSSSNTNNDGNEIPHSETDLPQARQQQHQQPPQAPPLSDLPEQFRATLARLTTSLPRLRPLPAENCSFTLAIELRDEAEAEAPIGREEDKTWIAAESGWQKPNSPNAHSQGDLGGANQYGRTGQGDPFRRGKYRGGVRTTPVRSIEAGAFQMEVWVEEGKGKFEASVEDEGDKPEGENN